MSEQPSGEGQFSDRDEAQVALVLEYRRRIDDAYESGSGDNVSELILEMKAACNPDAIRFVEAELRRVRQQRLMGRSLLP